MAADTKDNLHVAYYDNRDNVLNYATNVTGTWRVEWVHQPTPFLGVGRWAQTSIAVAADDTVHISYHVTDTSRYIRTLKHITGADNKWQIENLFALICIDMRGTRAIRLDCPATIYS